MLARSISLVLAAALGAYACVVPGFEVGPVPQAAGAGGSTAGAGGSTAGAGGSTAGAGGSTAGAGGSTAGGAGSAGSAGTAGGAAGPTRVGFSVFHDSGGGADDASSNLPDATFAKPAGTTAGDFILVFFGADHSLQHLTSLELSQLGWTLHDQHADYGGDGQGTYLIYKFAGNSEPASYVFKDINPMGPGNGVQGLLSVYRGVNPNAPVDAYATDLNPTGSTGPVEITTPTPSITTTVDNCLLIAGLSPDSAVDAPVIKTWPAGFDENRVSVINPPNPNPLGWANIYSAERHLAQAGTLPASSFVWDIQADSMSYYGSLAFVLALSP